MQIGMSRPEAAVAQLSGISRSPIVSTTAGTPLDGASSIPVAAASAWPVSEQAFFEAWGSSSAICDLDGSGVVDGGDLGIWLTAQSEASSDSDLQGLLDAWGTASSEWDLNQDGVVDGTDLGIQLSGGIVEVEESNVPAASDLSVDGFASAWGTSDPAYDLNADGVVDGADLGLFLNQQGIERQDSDLMDRFMAAWGTADPDFDLNGDGTVDGADLGQLLSQESTEGRRLRAESEIDDLVERLTKLTMKRFDYGGSGEVSPRVFTFTSDPNGMMDPDGTGMLSRQEVSDLIRDRIDGLRDEGGLPDRAAVDQFAAKWKHFTRPIEISTEVVHSSNIHRAQRLFNAANSGGSSQSTPARAASKVADVLTKLGHEGIPSNLPSLLDRVSLPGTSSQAVMYELLQQNGIGAVEETA